jgi:hypothetical protein
MPVIAVSALARRRQDSTEAASAKFRGAVDAVARYPQACSERMKALFEATAMRT